MSKNADKILEVENLHTTFFTKYNDVKPVRGVSFHLNKGEVIGLVGESGCGKSVTVRSIMRILQKPGKIVAGKIIYNEKDLLSLNEEEMKNIRGNNISMIFQDPMTALNPVLTIGYQISEVIKEHNPRINKKELRMKIVELLNDVNIPDAEMRLKQYPHEFSGGMRQRIMIAMALANNPDILIADEPTTALDVTIQDQILKLMKRLKEEKNKSIILITHDLGVVAETCDRVIVMYAGIVVEEGNVYDIFETPSHPYTIGLLHSLPAYNDDKNNKLYSIPGSPPNLSNEITGCPFASRCENAMKLCLNYMPDFIEIDKEHKSRCFLCYEDVKKMIN